VAKAKLLIIPANTGIQTIGVLSEIALMQVAAIN
jgi:hypothetical protein